MSRLNLYQTTRKYFVGNRFAFMAEEYSRMKTSVNIKIEDFRDKTLDWFERIFDGNLMEKTLWILMAVAAGYLVWFVTK